MSSRSKSFECHWQASRSLLAAYLAAQALVWSTLWLLDIPWQAALAGGFLCIVHAVRVLPRTLLFSHPRAFKGVRHRHDGWQVCTTLGGWQAVSICADSLVMPALVVLRFRLLQGARRGWLTHSVCIPRDALAADSHRRLRVLLRFARHG